MKVCVNGPGHMTKMAAMALRVNITIVYEHTVCATLAFSMCMLRAAFKVVLF